MTSDTGKSPLTLLIERRGPIEIITLNRPKALNALSDVLVTELYDYVHALDRQQVMLTTSDDHIEAMTAFFDKRLPVYQGR